MKKIDSLLNPSNIRARYMGGAASGDDSGAMLVEAMIYFAVVILIAGQVVPELMKALERAEVDNMRAAVTTASGGIEMDHGYTGTVKFTNKELTDAIGKVKIPGDITLTTGLVAASGAKNTATATTAKDVGYYIIAESNNSSNYCVRYSSVGFATGTGAAKSFAQFEVKAKGTCGTW